LIRPLKVPRVVLERYVQEYGGYVQFWGGTGHAAIVVCDGVIRQLVPIMFWCGCPETTTPAYVNELALNGWIQSRKGTVLETKPLRLEEMRARFGRSF
jgi:hypothetical protein